MYIYYNLTKDKLIGNIIYKELLDNISKTYNIELKELLNLY